MNSRLERGISVSSGELAYEGVDAVLDRIATTGATTVGLSLSMIVPADDGGSREPPIDIDGERRQLDRPLWGQRALAVHRRPLHSGHPELWQDLPWAPPQAAPQDAQVDYPRQAIAAARARGLYVYVNLSPYTLPSVPTLQISTLEADTLRDKFRPQPIVGDPGQRAIAYTGCLNHPQVRQLGRVRVQETLLHYGDVDGLSVDWVEYPVYLLGELFTCFCEHCQARAAILGYDWQKMTASVSDLWQSLHALTPEKLQHVIMSGDWSTLLSDPNAMADGLQNWLAFKAASVADALRDLRTIMDAHSGEQVRLSTNGFALPWGRISGAAHPSRACGIHSHRIKLHSFHWLMMVRWWTSTLNLWNNGSQVDLALLTQAVLSLFDIQMTKETGKLEPSEFGMPAPDMSHYLAPESYTNRLERALAYDGQQVPMMPMVHAYRSADDFANLLETVRPFATEGIWIQRYGYLSDRKLQILRQDWGG